MQAPTPSDLEFLPSAKQLQLLKETTSEALLPQGPDFFYYMLAT
jgi:hypothetical protein